MSPAPDGAKRTALVGVDAQIPPLPAPVGRRRTALDLHSHLHDLIVNGTLAPGTQLAQAEVARALGVSRSPLREAFRMLAQEHLIVAEPDQRAVVAPFDLGEQDSIWAMRVLTESLAVQIAADRLSSGALADLESALDGMRTGLETGDDDLYGRSHRAFHDTVDGPAGRTLNELVRTLADRTSVFMASHNEPIPHSKQEALDDHVVIYAALAERDPIKARHAAAMHIGRPAIIMLAHVAPTFEPHAVRVALSSLGIDATGL